MIPEYVSSSLFVCNLSVPPHYVNLLYGLYKARNLALYHNSHTGLTMMGPELPMMLGKDPALLYSAVS